MLWSIGHELVSLVLPTLCGQQMYHTATTLDMCDVKTATSSEHRSLTMKSISTVCVPRWRRF